MHEVSGHFHRSSRRCWLWLVAALLPCAVYAAPTKHSPKPLELAISPAGPARWTPDNRSFILAGRVVQLWEVTTYPPRSRVLCQGCGLDAIHAIFSPNRKRAVCELYPENNSLVVGLAKNETFKVEGKHPIFSDNQHLVTVNDEDGVLKIKKYQIGQAKPLWSTIIKPPTGYDFALYHEGFTLPDTGETPTFWDEWAWAVSPDGSRAAVLVHKWTHTKRSEHFSRAEVLIFETQAGKILRQIAAMGTDELEFASDSRHLIVKGAMRFDGSFGYTQEGAPHYKQVWDTYTGRLEQRFHYKGFKPPSYEWPDPMSEIARWTGKNGKKYKIPHLLKFSFSPDKKWLFTQSANNFSLWNVQHGKRLCSSRKCVDVAWESFSPDNKFLAVTYNQTLFLYRLK
jgi:WD40 repeat protein